MQVLKVNIIFLLIVMYLGLVVKFVLKIFQKNVQKIGYIILKIIHVKLQKIMQVNVLDKKTLIIILNPKKRYGHKYVI